jgi:predicted DNA-binding transcriptional regulator AlpA
MRKKIASPVVAFPSKPSNPANAVVLPCVPVDPANILTRSELAKRLKVRERWIYEKTRRRYSDPLPTMRIGRFIRFDWLEVSAWLAAHSNVKRAA